MADNIKIVGNIIDTTEVSRYSSEDIKLIPSQKIDENFGGKNNYIEFYVYDVGDNLLNTSYNYLDYKLPPSLGLKPGVSTSPNIQGDIPTENVGIVSTLAEPTSSLYPIIEIDPIQDLQKLGYTSGEFKVRYNLFQNILSNYRDKALFIKEISPNRTEVRLGSISLTNDEIENVTLSLIDKINTSPYYVDYLLNFGDNNQVVAINIALNKAPEGYEVLFKLYQPLPLSIQEKQTLWIVEEKVNPYIFDINLDKFIISTPPPTLRGPNFDIPIKNQGTVSTIYIDHSTALLSLKSLQSSSYNQILNLMNTQSIQINVDYTDFDNFIFFGSAYQRITNFYTKVKQIEFYNNKITQYTPFIPATASLQTELNQYSASINTLVSQFDGYESYLYFESSSYTWPKANSTKPYSLLSTGSATVLSWYNALTSSALLYDNGNQDNLEYAVPNFIRDDANNSQYLTFINMIGHYFDNIWIYLKAITDINLANNNLNKGISKDLVYNQLQSLGIKLYNSQAGEDLDQFLIGANSGSSIFNNDFSITSSYLNNIPRKDLLAELYKRIYHNLPLLLKTKGTKTGLDSLMSIFGISNQTYYTIASGSISSSFYTPTGSNVTASILNIKEFGGSIKKNYIKGYNNDKVRITPNSIAAGISGSVLSPLLSLQTYTTASAQFRENDMHYVDISFSPETQIDAYVSSAIASNNPTWNLDDYIGDPRQRYDTTYPDLETERITYFETGVPGFAPFTGSALDYNGFIRLIQFFDNALFKMLGDFVPERTSLSTGVTINSPVLERNKVPSINPRNSTTQSVPTAEYNAPTMSAIYGSLYNNLTGSKKAYFTGELSGSELDIYPYFSNHINPYLGNWSVWNSQHAPTQSINQNTFDHSDFNVLLNNVSKSRASLLKKKVEWVYGTTQTILTTASLQDSNETLSSYQLSRHDGVQLFGDTYNTFKGSDISYGKDPVIERRSYKFAWAKNIPPVSKNFYDKTSITIKYLVDNSSSLDELSQANRHVFETQNIFKSGTSVIISLTDPNLYSNQTSLNGRKTIFDGGFSYSPILYRENFDKMTFQYLQPSITVTNAVGVKAISSGSSWVTLGNYDGYFTDPSDQPNGFPNVVYPRISTIWNGVSTTQPAGTKFSAVYNSIYQWDNIYPAVPSRVYYTYQANRTANNPFYNDQRNNPHFPEDNTTSWWYDNKVGYWSLDFVKFAITGSSQGGWTQGYSSGFPGSTAFDTAMTIQQDTNGETYTQFTAPKTSTYNLSMRLPLQLGIYLVEGIFGGQSPVIIKVVGIVEKLVNGQWIYQASTKLRIDQLPRATNPVCGVDANNNAIWWSPGTYNDPFLVTAVLDNFSIALSSNDKLRVKCYMLEMYRYFIRGEVHDFTIRHDGGANVPYIQIIDINASATSYATTASVAQGDTLFNISESDGKTLVFSTGSSLIYGTNGNNTQFTNISSSISSSYTDVENPFTLQQGDLIRFGSFFNKNSVYYNVTSIFPPQISFSGSVPAIQSPLKVTLDKAPDTTLINSGSSFAILRRKPDETSVIVNFLKPPGETSQALLLSDDLSQAMKDESANIAAGLSQQLNPL